jgi:ABC-2 type transport system permease protein
VRAAAADAPGVPAGPLPRLPRLLAGQLGYQARLLSRAPRALISAFLLPVLVLTVRHAAKTPGPAADTVTAGAAAFGIIMTGYVTHAVGLMTARNSGILKRLRGAPLPPAIYFTGRIAATTLLAVLAAGVTCLLAVLAFGARLAADAVPAALAGVILGALAWAALGTAAASLIPDASTAQAMLSATALPVVFFSGFFFPLADEPGWLAAIARWLPAQPLADILSQAISGGHGAFSLPARDVLVLTGWAAAAGLIALRIFRWEPARPRHRARRGPVTP